MAPSTANIDHNKDLLRIVIDHGTGELKISAQWIPAGASNRNPQPFTIKVVDETSMTQKAVLEGDVESGHLILGEYDVNQWARHNPGQMGRVCQLWKLVLSKEYRDTPTGRAVFQAIGAEHGNMETFEEFLTMHFKQVRQMIIARLTKSRFDFPSLQQATEEEAREYWTNFIQVETLLMVPAKWSQDAQSIMIAAATDAGFNNVGPVYESLVAVASEIHGAEQKNRIGEGDIVVVLDIGRGTVDIDSGMLEPQTHVLKLAGAYSTCGMAGAQRVNDFGIEWVETCTEVLKQGRSIHAVCRRMGIAVSDFRYQVSDELELAKFRFPNKFHDFRMIIRAPAGWDKIENGLAMLDISIPWETMKGFFDRQLEEVFALLDSHLHQHAQDSIRGAIATGGGAKNIYVRQRLDEFFINRSPIGRPCFDPQDQAPTCHAALQHYPENHAQELPEGVLYICRGEDWDPKLHPDARPGTGLIKRDLVHTDQRERRTRFQRVNDRLTTIMGRRDGEQPVGHRVVMVFNVLASKPGRLKFPLFHSTNPTREHEAAYDRHGDPQVGLVKWTVRFANMTGNFSSHEFPAVKINDRLHHVVTTIVAVEGNDTHLDLVLQVIKGEDLQYDEEGTARTDVPYEPLIERRMEVWDRFRSYFPIKDQACPPEKIKPSVASDRPSTLSRLMARQSHTDGTSRASGQRQIDSGVSVTSTSRESSLFVGDTPKAREICDQPANVYRTKLRRLDKRKRTELGSSTSKQQGEMYAFEGSDDELSRPAKRPATKKRSPPSKERRTVSKSGKTRVDAQATTLYPRFERNDGNDTDNDENITVTPRNAFQAPTALMRSPSSSSPLSTPPRSAPAPARSRAGASSPDIKAGLDEASKFLGETSAWLSDRDRIHNRL